MDAYIGHSDLAGADTSFLSTLVEVEHEKLLRSLPIVLALSLRVNDFVFDATTTIAAEAIKFTIFKPTQLSVGVTTWMVSRVSSLF